MRSTGQSIGKKSIPSDSEVSPETPDEVPEIEAPRVEVTHPEVAYSSNDIYLAAALICKKKLPQYNVQGKRVAFLWYDKDAPEIANAYYMNQLDVDACGYSDTVRKLKTIVHNLSGSAF